MADIQSFITTYGPAAAASASALGTTPENVLGHWGLETGWGKSVIPGTNNLGNIKSTNGQGVAATDNMTGSRDQYQAFADPSSFAAGYTKLLSNPRYAGVVGAQDPQTFASGLKSGGYAEDPNYVNSLVGAIKSVQNASPQTPAQSAPAADSIDAQKAALAQQVTEDYARGAAPLTIITGLLKTKLAGPDVQAALAKGKSPEHIVNVVGGEPLAQFKASDPTEQVKSQSFGTNLMQGAGNAVDDMTLAGKQILNSDPQQAAALQAQAIANQNDPKRQALGNTVGGNVGNFGVKAVPALAAAALTDGAAIPLIAGQALAGGVSGALTPTTTADPNERLKNAAVEALVGGGAGAAGAVGGKLIGGLTNKVISSADAPERQALIDAARAQGLPVSASNVSPFWGNVVSKMPDNGAVSAFRDKADQAIASKVAEGVGLQGYSGPIDHELLNAARPAIQSQLDNATNITVQLPTTLQADLAPFMKGAGNPLTEGIAGNATVARAAENLTKAAANGTPVSGKMLQELASELKAVAQNPAASVTDRQAAGNLVGKVNQTLTSSMAPDQAAAFQAANKQYANLKAVEKMVTSSGDSGVVSPRQMLNAVKTGRFKTSFLTGDAPYQELGSTAADLYGPANGRGLGAMLGKLGNHDLTAATVIEPHIGLPAMAAKFLLSKAAGKLATSENPTIVRLLSGTGKGIDPTMKAYIAKALGGSAGAAADT